MPSAPPTCRRSSTTPACKPSSASRAVTARYGCCRSSTSAACASILKWVVGFSDVTMLHLALGRLGVESLHATMPGKFRFGSEETADCDRLRRSAAQCSAGTAAAYRHRPTPAQLPGHGPRTPHGRQPCDRLLVARHTQEPDFDAPHGALHRGGRRTHVPPSTA